MKIFRFSGDAEQRGKRTARSRAYRAWGWSRTSRAQGPVGSCKSNDWGLMRMQARIVLMYLAALCVFWASQGVGVLSAGEIAPGSLAYLDAKNGFRELHFGDPPKKDMILVESFGEEKVYKRSRENLIIGAAKVENIVYLFYKNRLSSVIIWTKGIINSSAMLEVLREAYGAGFQSNQYLEHILWSGSKVNLLYAQNVITRDAQITFFSIPIGRETEKDNESKAKKGVRDL